MMANNFAAAGFLSRKRFICNNMHFIHLEAVVFAIREFGVDIFTIAW